MKLITLIAILCLVQLTACTSFFPDKEKDYLLSQSIKPLEFPPDVEEEEAFAELEPVLIPSDFVKTIDYIDTEETHYLLVNSSLAHVWRIVAKALTASSIEITDKDRSISSYFVQYDPELQPIPDGSFMDEVNFFFGSDPNQEMPYQIFLTQTDTGTEIHARHDTEEVLTHEDEQKLLRLLFVSIQEDFSE